MKKNLAKETFLQRVMNRSIVVEDDLTDYEGMTLVVTFLNEKKNERQTKTKIDFSKYGHRTERGQKVDEYIEEMRGNDRIERNGGHV